MKIATVALTALLTLSTAPLAFAGPGHEHNHGAGGHTHGSQSQKIDDKTAIATASKGVAKIIEQKQPVEGVALDAAWANVTEGNKKISKKGNGYYIVSFAGENAKTLYVLLSDAGEVYDANYSGKFEGLKD